MLEKAEEEAEEEYKLHKRFFFLFFAQLKSLQCPCVDT